MLILGGRGARSSTLLALDRSLRSVDADGHMRVEASRISKANISPYLGREIPDWERLKLDPTRTYRLFRDPKELEKGASTFDGKPLLIRHEPIAADLPRKELWVGTLGVCSFEAPYLMTRPLMVLTQEAIDLIDAEEQRELSAGYRYDAEMIPGTWGGEQYDGRMVNIRGNHVAIVREGRVGPDVHVADELPPELRTMTNAAAVVAKELAPHLKGLTDSQRRLVAMALDGMLGETPAESVISLDESEKKAAEDEALAEKKEKQGADAKLDDEEREQAYEKARDKKAKDKKAKDKKARDDKAKDGKHGADDDKHGKDGKHGADDDKHGKDSEVDHRKDFESIAQKAKDEMSAELKKALESQRAEFRAAAEAREKVRPLVGSVSIAMDSAPEIYRFALKHANVKTEGVHDSALGALVDMAVDNHKRSEGGGPTIAMDAAAQAHTDIDALFRPKAA